MRHKIGNSVLLLLVANLGALPFGLNAKFAYGAPSAHAPSPAQPIARPTPRPAPRPPSLPPIRRPVPPPVHDPDDGYAVTPGEVLRQSDRINRLLNLQIDSLSSADLRAVSRYLMSIGNIVRDDPYTPPPSTRLSYLAECHVDDDTSLDYGQTIVGTLDGDTPEQILGDCKAIARSMYGTFSSAGIKKLVLARGTPYGLKTAECWIDDDTSFDFGQNLVGTVAARDVLGLTIQCKSIATLTFGTFSSAGIKNIH